MKFGKIAVINFFHHPIKKKENLNSIVKSTLQEKTKEL
jgi:hypothetical protein